MNATQKICLRALEKETKALTVAQITDIVNLNIEQCRQVLAWLHQVRKVHIAGWMSPQMARMYLVGGGDDVPKPQRKTKAPEKSKWKSQTETLNEERVRRKATTMARRAAVKGSVWEIVI